jgi:hypothetical protein
MVEVALCAARDLLPLVFRLTRKITGTGKRLGLLNVFKDFCMAACTPPKG